MSIAPAPTSSMTSVVRTMATAARPLLLGLKPMDAVGKGRLNGLFRLLETHRTVGYGVVAAASRRDTGDLPGLTQVEVVDVPAFEAAVNGSIASAYPGTETGVAIEAINKVLRAAAHPDIEQADEAERERALDFLDRLIERLS